MEIRIYPDPVLREKAKEIKEFDIERIDYMIKIMEEVIKEYDAVGLAANQIGIMEQIIVVNVDGSMTAIINPKIVSASGQATLEEGCLSFPTVEFTLPHHKTVTVEGLDRCGEPYYVEAEGLLAKVLEHEIDHINGVLIIDKLSPAERLEFEMQWKRGEYERKNPSRVL